MERRVSRVAFTEVLGVTVHRPSPSSSVLLYPVAIVDWAVRVTAGAVTDDPLADEAVHLHELVVWLVALLRTVRVQLLCCLLVGHDTRPGIRSAHPAPAPSARDSRYQRLLLGAVDGVPVQVAREEPGKLGDGQLPHRTPTRSDGSASQNAVQYGP